MNKNKITYYDHNVNDGNEVLIANLSAQYNGGIKNIVVNINTADGYKDNKDVFDDELANFIKAIEEDNAIPVVDTSTIADVSTVSSESTKSSETVAMSESITTSDSIMGSESETTVNT